jgi:two-component system, cell cycle response regulator CtrA
MTRRCESCGHILPDFGGIVADPDRGEVRFHGRAVILTMQEFSVFAFLLGKQGKMASKDTIFDHLYQLSNEDIEIKIIDVWICKLRRKISKLGLAIDTSWGRGYALVAPDATDEAA